MDPGIRHLLEASVKLGCSLSTKIRAMILYHHFMRCVDEVKYDAAMVAAAALNLSSKIGEEVIELDTLVLIFYCIVKKTDEVLDSDDASFVLLRKSLITVDFIMQRMLEFTLNHQLAHQYLLPFLELVFSRSGKLASYHQSMSETSLSLVSDFYTNNKSVNYKPEHIAVACIDAAMHMYELEKTTEINDPWYEGLCSDLTPEKVKEIKHDVFLLYKEEARQPSPRSPAARQPNPSPRSPAARQPNPSPAPPREPTSVPPAPAEDNSEVIIELEKDVTLEDLYPRDAIEEIVLD